MSQSNSYVIKFTVILTIVLGGLLSLASVLLRPIQQKSVEIDTKKQILGAVMSLEGKSNNDILSTYDAVIKSLVVDINGEEVKQDESGQPVIAEDVDVARMYKISPEKRKFPVFKYHKEGKEDDVLAYIFPVYGVGLWGPIWGFLALDTDFKTLKGVVFDHETETPGLGARITEGEVQNRFQNKKVYNESGELVSVTMLKGENNPSSRLDDHHVDGLSGATITAVGVNDMLKAYLKFYESYIKKAADGKIVAYIE
ncbi:MAG: NADH:ubiquinone reductase (Na(+)-transporting) subunit C [Cyclobacteriaceae bacterium]|nr:NADH:ubiquinone reductase (Na(+)-transporting) subunit C [Cyclobacteriaceae bacterium]